MKIIAIDVDGVVAEIHVPWLARYNRDYNDNFTVEQWTTWDVHTLLKPECGGKFYKYIEDPTLYDETSPVPGALERIKVLKHYFRIIYITTSTLGASGKKFLWLKEHKFITDQNDYFECKDKSLVYSDYLIDDNIKTIETPPFFGKRENIIFTQPWNKDFKWEHRLKDWNSFYDFR